MITRAYAIQDSGHWVAVNVDLCLAAQADSAGEACKRLRLQVSSYMHEARTVDKRMYHSLVPRKAPVGMRLKWWACRLMPTFTGGYAYRMVA